MKTVSYLATVLMSCASFGALAQQKPNPARERVLQAAQVMGGEAALRNLQTVRVESLGHRFYLEQSERPDGPWIAGYETKTEFRDYSRASLPQAASVQK